MTNWAGVTKWCMPDLETIAEWVLFVALLVAVVAFGIHLQEPQ